MPRGRSTTPSRAAPRAAAKASPSPRRAPAAGRKQVSKSPAPRPKTPARATAQETLSAASTPATKRAPRAPPAPPAATTVVAESAAIVPAVVHAPAAPASAPAPSAAPSRAVGTRELLQFVCLVSAIAFVAHKQSGITFLSDGWLTVLALVPLAGITLLTLRSATDSGKIARDSFTTWALLFLIIFTTSEVLQVLTDVATPGLHTALGVLVTLYRLAQTVVLLIAVSQMDATAPASNVWTVVTLAVFVALDALKANVSLTNAWTVYMPTDDGMDAVRKLTVFATLVIAAIGVSRAITSHIAGHAHAFVHFIAAVSVLLLSTVFTNHMEDHAVKIFHADKSVVETVAEWVAVMCIAFVTMA